LAYSTRCLLLQIKHQIANHLNLNYDPQSDRMLLYGCKGDSDEPGTTTMKKWITSYDRIFFRLFPGTPEAELELRVEIKVRVGKQPVYSVLVRRSNTIRELFETVNITDDQYFAMKYNFTNSLKLLN